MRGLLARKSKSTSGKMALSATRIPAADGGGALQLQAVDGGVQVLAAVGRRLHQRSGSRECDDADPGRARLLVDEGLGRVLRRGHAVGLDVLRAHAARHIEREDDDLVLRGQPHHRRGTRHRHDHDHEREEEKQRGHVAPELWARAHRFTDHRQAGVAQRRPGLAAQDEEVGRDEERHQREQPEEFGPEEGHRTASRCAAMRAALAVRAGGELGAALAQVGEAQDRVGEVVVGGELERVDAGVAEGLAQLELAAARELGEALAEAPVVRVDEELLAGLGVLHHEQADVRELHLERIVQAHRDHLMAAREQRERLGPAGRADEIGHHEDERAALHHRESRVQQLLEARPARALEARARRHPVHQMEHVAPAAARRNDRVDLVAIEQRPDPVAVPGEQAREHRDEVDRHRALAHLARAEVDRRREVEQEPGVDVAVLVVLAHVGRLQARGDVPVDVAHVIVILVLAQVGEVQTKTPEQRSIVSVQEPVEPTDHRPLELLQELLKIPRRLLL
jgi:hypothetical protein